MYLNNGILHVETSSTGAGIHTLQKGSKHFFYPRQMVDMGNEVVRCGGMHACSSVFSSAEGGVFFPTLQNEELEDSLWEKRYVINEFNRVDICYKYEYIKRGTNLQYFIVYSLKGNQLKVRTDIVNCVSNPNYIELGWHPYFNSPDGGVVRFLNSEIPDIMIYKSHSLNIFPVCDRIVIELNGIGRVIMEFKYGFDNAFVRVRTDWERKYFCVEPLLRMKYGKGIKVVPENNALAVFTMTFED
ncbi:aldose 1-epimerase [Candidatus Parcubacteria bacterium]|nr:aldose 1-epimerase [Candidatus Parcubacteria bacterium]